MKGIFQFQNPSCSIQTLISVFHLYLQEFAGSSVHTGVYQTDLERRETTLVLYTKGANINGHTQAIRSKVIVRNIRARPISLCVFIKALCFDIVTLPEMTSRLSAVRVMILGTERFCFFHNRINQDNAEIV